MHNYPIRECVALTQNRTVSWSLPSVYIYLYSIKSKLRQKPDIYIKPPYFCRNVNRRDSKYLWICTVGENIIGAPMVQNNI